MPPRQRRTVISDVEWERVRPVIRHLYLREDMTLSFVLGALKTMHNFNASKAQLECKLKQWYMVKNMTAQQWKCVDSHIRERQNRGKESSLYLSGVPLRPAAVEKARIRHCYTSFIEQFLPSLAEPSLSADLPLLIRTPSPSKEFRDLDLTQNLPWIQCQQILRALAIHSSVPRHISDMLSTPVLVRKGLYNIMFPERFLMDYTPNLQQIFHALSVLIPEKGTDSHSFRAAGLIQSQPSSVDTPEAFEVLVFLLSNGFCGYLNDQLHERDAINEAILAVFRELNMWKLLISQQCKSLPLSIQAVLYQIFERAILASDSATIKSLALAGIDVDVHLNNLYVMIKHHNHLRALHWAVFKVDIPMVELLVELGTNIESIDLDMLRIALCRRQICDQSALDTLTRWLLSLYQYEDDHEPEVRLLLDELGHMPHSATTELVLHFFEPKLQRPASIAQLLITAIKTGSSCTFQWASKHQRLLNFVNFLGESALGVAASKNEYQLCCHLLELGAIPDPVIDFGLKSLVTPLQHAASSADPALIKLLLDHGADVNSCQVYPGDHFDGSYYSRKRQVRSCRHFIAHRYVRQIGRTALQAALSSGREENFLFLLSRGARLFGEELGIATRNRRVSFIKHLLAQGASYTAPSLSYELSPLESAILVQDTRLALQIIRTLDAAKFPARAVYAAVYMASATADWTVFRELLNMSKMALITTADECWIGSALSLCLILNIDDAVEQILTTGFHPRYTNTVDYLRGHGRSWSRLSSSSLQNHEEMYLEVLDHGETGELYHRALIFNALLSSPICVARMTQHGYQFDIDCSAVSENPRAISVLPLLQRGGAILDRLLLTRAILNGASTVIDWYIASGTGVNTVHWHEAQPFHGTPLGAAAAKGDLSLIETLVSMGADVNEDHQEFLRHPPLTEAARSGFFGVVKRLLELGANPNAPGGMGATRTALEMASQGGRLDIVQLLLESGVSIEGSGRLQYVRAVAFARAQGHPAVEQLLRSFRRWTKADQEILEDPCLCSETPIKFNDSRGKSSWGQNMEDDSVYIGLAFQRHYYDLEDEIEMTPRKTITTRGTTVQHFTSSSEAGVSLDPNESSEASIGNGKIFGRFEVSPDQEDLQDTLFAENEDGSIKTELGGLHEHLFQGSNSDDDWMEKYIRFPSETPSIC